MTAGARCFAGLGGSVGPSEAKLRRRRFVGPAEVETVRRDRRFAATAASGFLRPARAADIVAFGGRGACGAGASPPLLASAALALVPSIEEIRFGVVARHHFLWNLQLDELFNLGETAFLSEQTNDTALPRRPARPVRPMRWM